MNFNEAKRITSNIGRHYYRFEVAKKTGGRRVIVAPSDALKKLQWMILKELEERYTQETCSTCSKGRGTVPNASCHVGRKIVVKLDIKNFFGSISRDRVYRALENAKIALKNLDLYTDLCTFRGKLPTGSPVSPFISSILCKQLDSKMIELAQQFNAFYTRYVDDLTFSSDDPGLNHIISPASHIISNHGFKLNNAKVKIMRDSNVQIVTGVTVNEKVNVPRRIVRNFRARVHKACNMSPGLERDKELCSLVGYLAYFESINPVVSGKYKTILINKGLI